MISSRRLPPAKSAWYRLGRFAVIGLLNAILYALATWWFVTSGHMAPESASLFGYVACIPFAYLGHRWVTFTSSGNFPVEAVRFIAVHVTGLLVSWCVMDLVANRLGLHFTVGIVAAVVLVPLLTFVVLDRFVFGVDR